MQIVVAGQGYVGLPLAVRAAEVGPTADAVRAGLQERYRLAVDLGLGEEDFDFEERQRKPITVRLVLSSSHGLRISYKTWNEGSWKPALASAGVLREVGRKVEQHGARTRRHPVFERSRRDMFHVLRHTYASVQLEAGESIVSVSAWLGHSSPNITLDHYAHFMPGAGQRGLAVMDAWLACDQQRKVPEKSLAPS